MQEDRRKTRRIPLDSLYFIKISIEGNETVTCLVLDISAGGLMLGLPPGMEEAAPAIGAKAVIRDSSPKISEVLDSNLEATIMWTKEGLCGLSFEAPQPRVGQTFVHDDFE